MILGKLNLNNLLIFYIPVMFLTPLYTYHMAVSHKQEPPFPHATVTSTAEHYPQNIVFRYIMLFCSSILAFTFFIVFRWLEFQAKRVGFKKLHKALFYIAESSILCYGITIGTIDGKGTGKLHGINAVIFFIVWFATITNVTVYMNKLRSWDCSVMSKWSLIIKNLLAIYITGIWTYCIYGLINGKNDNKSDIYVVILEWNSVLVNLLWVLTMVFEWRKFNICLIKNK